MRTFEICLGLLILYSILKVTIFLENKNDPAPLQPKISNLMDI